MKDNAGHYDMNINWYPLHNNVNTLTWERKLACGIWQDIAAKYLAKRK